MCCNGCLPICVLPMPNVRPAQSGKRTSAAEGRPQIMRRDSRLALRSIGGQWDWRLRCIRTVHGKRFIFAPTPVLFYRKRQAGAWSQAISVYHDTERRAILKLSLIHILSVIQPASITPATLQKNSRNSIRLHPARTGHKICYSASAHICSGFLYPLFAGRVF